MARGSIIQDPGLAELVRVKNYRQALKNIDKKLKKQPNDFKLLVVKADLLHRTGELPQSQQLWIQVASRATPDVDTDTISSLNGLAHALAAGGFAVPNAQLEGLWSNAVKGAKSSAAKLDILDTWLFEALSKRQWTSFTKAAMLTAKLVPESDPTHRKYYFWQVLGYWISKPDASLKDERLRGLSQMMATRMLDKAVEQTPTGPSECSKAPPQSVSKRQDFELLVAVFSDLGRMPQVITTLEEKRLGEHSPPAVDEWGTRLVKLDHLLHQKDFDKAWELCKAIFDSAESLDLHWKSDDWAFWERLLKASTSPARLQAVRDLAVGTGRRIPGSRAPALAILESHKRQAELAEGTPVDGQQAALLQEAKTYFDRFSSQSGCSTEIESAMQNLSTDEARDLRAYLSGQLKSEVESMSQSEQLKWIIGETNVLRLDLDRLLDVAPGDSVVEQFESFVCKSLDFHRVSRRFTGSLPDTEVTPSDEACLLAVRALVKLYEMSNERAYLAQSALLLSDLLQSSRHNASARVMLVNILVSLGLPSLALTHYQALKVRQILVESCAPLVFHRVATLMPFRAGSQDFYKIATEHLSFYSDAMGRIPDHQMVALDAENYVQVKEMDSFRARLQNSACRRMLLQERRRMARFRSISCNEDGLGVDEFPPCGPFDWNDTPPDSCHIPIMGEQVLVRDLPVINNPHLILEELINLVLDAVYASSPLEASLSGHLSRMADSSSGAADEQLPTWEQVAFSQASDMASVLVVLSDLEAQPQSTLENRVLEACARVAKGLSLPFVAESAPTSLSQSWAIPPRAFYHATLTELEILMAQCKLAAKVSSQCKSRLSSKAAAKMTAHTTQVRQAATSRLLSLKQTAKGFKRKVASFQSDKDALSRLLSPQQGRRSEVGQSIESTLGLPAMKRLLGDFTQAAGQALDGIEQVTLP